ncbi:Rtt106 domain-containing protein [Mycena indigotica]|uniref:Rtt106 domain-containing protein n=1 Tax=Mycena indigotica TaxID=2126181 RepID=A0A8H6SPW9_9AGAR|nr:Rtt106 domain-containing protein [Mycena indigotica]KAF7303830.1 Rtt106 domain-containing protein [Mycena indigotica]
MAQTSHFLDFFPLAIDSLAFDPGVYSSLFFQCIQILFSHRRANYRLHLGCMFALYFLSTVHLVLAYTWAFLGATNSAFPIYEIFTLKDPPPPLFGPTDGVGVHALATLLKIRWVVANAIADGVLIHRCYVIWGCSWKAIAVPVLSYTCTIIGGFLEILPLPPASARAALMVGYGGVFFTNVVASALTGNLRNTIFFHSSFTHLAGRIWYQSRHLAKLMGSSPRRRYSDLTAIILESGLIYPALLIITIVIFLTPSPTVSVLVCIAVAYHLVGIAPTLIIVRVGLGVSMQDVQTSVTLGVSGATSSSRQGTKSPVLGPLRFALSPDLDATTHIPLSGWKTP